MTDINHSQLIPPQKRHDPRPWSARGSKATRATIFPEKTRQLSYIVVLRITFYNCLRPPQLDRQGANRRTFFAPPRSFVLRHKLPSGVSLTLHHPSAKPLCKPLAKNGK